MLGALGALPIPAGRVSRCRKSPWPSAFRAPDRPYRASPPAPTPAPTGGPLASPQPNPLAACVRLHLKPGQKGTKQLLATYADRLGCVRYRYDARLQLWQLRYDRLQALGLTDRIVPSSPRKHLPVDADPPPAAIYSQMLHRHPHEDACIYPQMPASGGRCPCCCRIIVRRHHKGDPS